MSRPQAREAAGAALHVRPLERHELEAVWVIDRSERIDHVYRLEDGTLALHAEHHDVRGWPEGEPEHYTPLLLDCFDRGGSCVGVFDGDRLVAASVLEGRFIGRDRDALQLKFLHVSHDRRGTGLGSRLFAAAADEARRLGARRLYVSATPSENTVHFYQRHGCRLAREVDPELFALEPEDIHLELDLEA